MLSLIVEILVELGIEFVIEAVVEVLVESGLYSAELRSKSRVSSPVAVAAGYVLIGGVLGALTTLLLPGYLIGDGALRAVGRLLSPIALGFMLCLVSWIIKRRDLGQSFFSLEKLIKGVVFGASYSAMRYFVS